jgi:hypothetical protein
MSDPFDEEQSILSAYEAAEIFIQSGGDHLIRVVVRGDDIACNFNCSPAGARQMAAGLVALADRIDASKALTARLTAEHDAKRAAARKRGRK